MLIPNLSVLLAQRHLTVTRVSEDTGLSRTTLTALCGGSARGIQFETLNTLCQYLKAAPGDLFLYRPFDIALADCPGTPGHTEITFTVRRAGRREERCALDCEARLLYADDASTLEALRVRLSTLPGDSPAAQRSRDLADLLRSLPTAALDALELAILRAFDRRLDPAARPADYTPDLEWP